MTDHLVERGADAFWKGRRAIVERRRNGARFFVQLVRERIERIRGDALFGCLAELLKNGGGEFAGLADPCDLLIGF